MGPTYCALCPLLYRRHEALELHLRPMRHQFYWLPFLPFPSGYGHTKKLTLSTYHGHWNHPGHNGRSIYPSKSSVGSLVPGPETGGHRWNSWNRPPSFNVCMEWFHWLCVMVYIPYFPKLSPFIAFFLTAHFSQDDYPYDWLVFSLRCTHPHLWFFFARLMYWLSKVRSLHWHIHLFASWTWFSNPLGVGAENLTSPPVHCLTMASSKTLRETWMTEKKTRPSFMARKSAKWHSFLVQVGFSGSQGEIDDWTCFIQRLHIQYITVAIGLGCVYLVRCIYLANLLKKITRTKRQSDYGSYSLRIRYVAITFSSVRCNLWPSASWLVTMTYWKNLS